MDRNCTNFLIRKVLSFQLPNQFNVFSSFITFRSCKGLDGKHSIFGKLVGGGETLNEMEKIEVDNKDRPIEDIVIHKAHVFVDPYEEVDEQLAKERADAKALQEKEAALIAGSSGSAAAKKKKDAKLTVFREGVGKYLNSAALKSDLKSSAATATSEAAGSSVPAKKQKRYDFGGFSGW